MSARILLADDHPMIRTALEVLLRRTSFELVEHVSTGSEALAATERLDPDLVLLDVKMPDGSGLSVLNILRERGDRRPVVLLTADLGDATLLEALKLGANGIVLKNSDPRFLLQCLEAVHGGQSWIDPELEQRIEALKRSAHSRPRLSARERQLVALVRKGLRNREIAEQLGVTPGTVKVYLHSIFDKVGVASRTELAMKADNLIGPDGL